MKTNGDDNAFACVGFGPAADDSYMQAGLTKREWMSAMAMQGLLAAVYSSKEMLNEFRREPGRSYISQNAISYADALIEELNKQEDP